MKVGDDPRLGTELAGYRVESVLGQGGMSVVYLAEDRRLKRKVALKLLAPDLAEDMAFRERFLRESELAASIDHPNIVPIYEAGASDDLLFIAMRYVEGSDLRERLRQGRLEPGEAIPMLAQVASALDAAHARGLVHRDVKPSNVLLDTGARPDGSDHVYLADFGLMKRLSEKTGLGDDSQLMGTIDYVAPEQIAGDETDGRADIYSLGCVLYECLVGEPPFPRDTDVAVVFAHLDAEPPVASEKRPELPLALDAVIGRALAKEAEERYRSCRELARAALTVTVDEASRLLAEVASRAAAGRSDLSQVEAELAGKVIDLQLVREQARALSPTPTPTRLATDGVCPFKGLASFEPSDADYFFGRERLIAELVARLVGATFLGIVGPSGSGKSSVLRAGLLPALAGGVLPGSERWRRVLIRPGERPLDELRRMLASGAKDPIAEALDALGPDERILLAVDQLEELFTTCSSEVDRAKFLESVARAASDPHGRAIVAVALRADFYGRFAGYPKLADLLGANNVLVGPMQASELRRAVELPAGRVGLKVEQELADVLVDDVEGEPGALPLLSTALLELWQKRADNLLALAAYRESGGVHGAVARLAEGTYARIPDQHQPLVRALMLRLVGEGEGEAAVRRRAPLAELDLERNEAARDVLATLADSRLVTVSEGTAEVAHEALLREWPRLRDWIEEDGQGRRLRRHITQAAAEWDGAGRDRGELYRGARLAAALDWTADHTLDLNELERAFVTESRDASEKETRRVRRTNRRLRGLLIGVAVLLATAVAGGIFAVLQRGEARDAAGRAGVAAGQARDAETAQLAQRLGAQALVEEDLDLALLLARQAVAIEDTPQTRGYLLAALQRSPAAIGIMHGDGDVLRGIAISPDGMTLAVHSGSRGVLFFDTETYARIGDPISGTGSDANLAYSPDGQTLAVGGDNSVRLIDAETRAQLAETNVGGEALHLAFTKDGSQLIVLVAPVSSDESIALGDADAQISVRDATTLEPVGRSIEPEAFVGAYVGIWYASPQFALTPDDLSLITASENGELASWDLRTRKKTRTWKIDTGLAPALAVSPDGLTVAVGIQHGVQLVDLRSGTARTATAELAGSPNWVLFSPDGRMIVSTNRDKTVTRWDVASATLLETLRGHSNFVQQPVFSPDGGTLYTVSHDGTAIAWDLTGDRRLGRPFTFTNDRTFSRTGYDGHPGRLSPDGRLFAVGLKEQGIALWDTRKLTPTGPPLLDTGGEVKTLAFSPDGQTLAAVTKRLLTLWDVGSRSRLHEPLDAGRPSIVLAVGFSPDGATLATASSGAGLKFWDATTGDSLDDPGLAHDASDVAFSADGAMIASVTPQSAKVWDVATGSSIAAFDRTSDLDSSVALSPDGHFLAVGGFGRVVRIWNVRTGKLVHELDQGGNGAFTLEFSPDGRTLAVSGFEPVASLWDVASGTQIGPQLTAGDRRTMVDLSSDGRLLLETHGNGQGAVWDVDPESWKQRACAVANRTLTHEEWERFLPGRPYEPACAEES
jgi:WD40 repeat protein/tRNA A-37 threonylcarbamoyl transferase component Bud32